MTVLQGGNTSGLAQGSEFRARDARTSLLALLALCYAIAYVDRLMMAVVAEPVKAEFQLTDGGLFFLTGSAFTLIYGLGGIGAGWLLDRYSRRKIIVWTLVLWSLFTAACGLAQDLVTLSISRAAIGLCEAAIVPAAVATISDKFDQHQRPLALAIFYAGGMAGIFVAWTLGGWIAQTFGWRNAFFLAGPPGILLAAIIMRVRWDSEADRRDLSAAPPGGNSTFRQVWENKPLVWTIIAGAVSTFVNIGLVTQLGSFYIRSHGLSLTEVGMIFGPILATGMACGLLLGGVIGNRLAKRGVAWLLSFSAVVTAVIFPLLLGMFIVETLAVSLAVMFVATVLGTLHSPGYAAAYQTLCEPRARATAAGLCNFFNSAIGGGLTPLAIGFLSDAFLPRFGGESLRMALMAGSATTLVAAGLFYYSRRLVLAAPPLVGKEPWK